ncbi:MAG TPA: hypothetical protein VMX55_07855 [candidate division Zixibacteria bacterium]|nr:hypothetical protein [candidate division Zixibacteria bacterium]
MNFLECIISSLALLVNATGDIPDGLQGIFATFWVFVVVTVVFSIIIFVIFIVVFIFIIRTIIKRSSQVNQLVDHQIELATKEINCQFCDTKLDYTMTHCPNCGAPITDK